MDGLRASLCAEECWPSDVRVARMAAPRAPTAAGDGEYEGDGRDWRPTLLGCESTERREADGRAADSDWREEAGSDSSRDEGRGWREDSGGTDAADTEATGLREGEVEGAGAAVEALMEAEVDARRLELDGCSPSSCWRYRSFQLGREADEVDDEEAEEALAAAAVE